MDHKFLQDRYDDIMNAAMILMKKNDVQALEIEHLRQSLKNTHMLDHNTGGILSKFNFPSKQNSSILPLQTKTYDMEVDVLLEKLLNNRRKLTDLQTKDICFSALLFSTTKLNTISIPKLSSFSAMENLNEEDIVLRWVNYQLSTIHLQFMGAADSGLPTVVNNFHQDFENCCVILLILQKIRGDHTLDFAKISVK